MISPPRWAVILILGTTRVKIKFTPRSCKMPFLPSGVTRLLCLWIRYRNAPKSPNKLPEAPADREAKLKKNVARFPPIPVNRKKSKYFLGPISISICGPKTYKAYPLNNICDNPICIKIELINL